MDKKHIIYIHGRLGAGKTSTADRIAEILKYDRMSAGYFFRQGAEEHGMSLVEFNQYIESDPATDIEVDQKQKEYMENHDKLVFDGRLGFYLMPKVIFNVFLELDSKIAAKRVWADKAENVGRRSERAQSLEEMAADLEKRAEVERRRLQQFYKIENCFDKSHFDLVVDTSKNNLEEVANIVIDAYKEWIAK